MANKKNIQSCKPKTRHYKGTIMNENQELNTKCNCKNETIWNLTKFAILLLTLFLACYLAIYYILDQIRHSYYLPAMPLENIDKIIEEQDRMFEKDLGTFPMQSRVLKQIKSPVETFKDDKSQAYKIIVNLKEFNNDPKNIKLDIQDDKVSIMGINQKTGKSNEKIYTFTQSFYLPEKINTKAITKEQSGTKYIITMPLEKQIDEFDNDD